VISRNSSTIRSIMLSFSAPPSIAEAIARQLF
jgi:hypothetical protein